MLTGTVDAIAPNPPHMMKTPLASARRSAGIHSAMAFSPAISAPDTPRPIKIRPRSNVSVF